MPDTPWRGGRFGGIGRKQILFGQMYEDASIECETFPAGSRIFAIASAGCTAIALAATCEVTAVDINPVQLEYARMRAEGAPARTGTAERVMAAGRGVLALGGWNRAALEEFARLDDIPAQMDFWRKRLDTGAFRFLLGAMLRGGSLRSVYSSPLHAVLPQRFDVVMRGRMERCWERHANLANPYVRRLLLGEMAPVTRGRICFACEDAAAFLEAAPSGGFDGFTLSNILDGAPEAYRLRLMAAVRHAAAPGAMAILRSFREPHGEATENLAARDRSFIWGTVNRVPAG